MQDVRELSLKHQRQFLVYAHSIGMATHLLAKATNLSQTYWANHISEIAVDVVENMSDLEVEEVIAAMSKLPEGFNGYVSSTGKGSHEN